jgi:hypothetical protein
MYVTLRKETGRRLRTMSESHFKTCSRTCGIAETAADIFVSPLTKRRGCPVFKSSRVQISVCDRNVALSYAFHGFSHFIETNVGIIH